MHIVMEHCDGGTLVDWISDRERYTEKAAASVFRSVVNALHACHSNGIMHRDLNLRISSSLPTTRTLLSRPLILAWHFSLKKVKLLCSSILFINGRIFVFIL